jgi:hypothetical protein
MEENAVHDGGEYAFKSLAFITSRRTKSHDDPPPTCIQGLIRPLCIHA